MKISYSAEKMHLTELNALLRKHHGQRVAVSFQDNQVRVEVDTGTAKSCPESIEEALQQVA